MNIRKKGMVFAVLALLLLSLPAASVSARTPPGTGTPGYWKNHPDEWSFESFMINGVTYDKDTTIELMKEPTRGDKSYTMFRAWVAARLNKLAGNEFECVYADWIAAFKWLKQNPVGSGVKASSDAWKEGEPLYEILNAYNNGLLCAPPRD